jgi:hypothetical protein
LNNAKVRAEQRNLPARGAALPKPPKCSGFPISQLKVHYAF